MSHGYAPRNGTPAYPTLYFRDFDRRLGWWPDQPRNCVVEGFNHGQLQIEAPSMAVRQRAFSYGRVFCLSCSRTYGEISPVGWRDGRR